MPIYYIPVAGTWGDKDGWVVDDNDPFTLFMRGENLAPRRREDGQPWNWAARLGGLWWTGNDVWHEAAESLYNFLMLLPYRERNVIAHSHGGQVAILAAALGATIRTLTTVGTPVRADIPALAANAQTGYWQHIYDLRWDTMASLRKRLGQIGDGKLEADRRFHVPGVVNIGVRDISHTRVLTDPKYFHLWKDNLWLDAIRNGPPFNSGVTHA